MYNAYCQFHIFVLFLYIEGPPSLDALLLEDIYRRYRTVRLEHTESAELAVFGSAREPIEVECYSSEKIIRRKVIGIPDLCGCSLSCIVLLNV